MANTVRDKAIKALNEYIWTLKDKNENICDLNKDLIMQFCRFSVLAEEMSVKIQKFRLDDDAANLMVGQAQMDMYAKYNKFMMQLYKALKMDVVKNDVQNYKNPFLELMQDDKDDF